MVGGNESCYTGIIEENKHIDHLRNNQPHPIHQNFQLQQNNHLHYSFSKSATRRAPRLKRSVHQTGHKSHGGLTLDELEHGLGKIQLFELLQDHGEENEDQYKEIMRGCDLDGDGKIDYSEFI